MTTQSFLTPLPDSTWKRVLCIVAHPDDMEYGASAAVHRWTAAGVEVGYVLLTGGENGMAEDPEVVRPLRAAEQREACATVGVHDLRILDHPDGMLEHNLDLRRSVAREVRRFRPDVVVVPAFSFEAYGMLNQADHRAAGMAVVDGVRDADNRWIFRELAEQESLLPWRTKALLVVGDNEPTHAVAVGQESVDAAVASLHCHAAYLAHVTGHPAPEEMIPATLRLGGEAAGAEYAVTFRLYPVGGLGD